MNLQQIEDQLQTLLAEFEQQVHFREGQLLVIGCSTSEIKGQKIGTAGGLEIAEALYKPLRAFSEKHGLFLAFQGCEHINRAITIEREAAEKYGLEPVSVVPAQKAGGSMSAYAYRQLKDPVVVEEVLAHAGIDMGQTLIGMHLKRVAVPLRTSITHIGDAVVTVATTRPKLIGGERAIYN
ncbi:TIGR01440 family protein [Rummeliibacillus stabekisii]|uniref:TIGR01440 family protein n=1 Tax=Rummeliibacillus stabekisii TaxID=241244 RepID=UPI00203FE8CC|nr:TIGR01440 family protein [Rummeliibacillus stabekisii]MCM3315222.1 TIGR01440 family protein [Rummeliibacillus stabekisii]